MVLQGFKYFKYNHRLKSLKISDSFSFKYITHYARTNGELCGCTSPIALKAYTGFAFD